MAGCFGRERVVGNNSGMLEIGSGRVEDSRILNRSIS